MVITILLAVLVLNTMIFNGVILYKLFLEPMPKTVVHPVEAEAERLTKETDAIVDEFTEFAHNREEEEKAFKAEQALIKGI